MPMLRTAPVYSTFGSGAAMQMGQNPPSADQGPGQGNPQARAFLEEMQRAMQGNANGALQRAIQTGVNVDLDALMGYYAIYPITIAKVIVDTLMFGLLIVFARSLALLFRAEYASLPDLGMMLALALITAVVGMAYYQYRGIAYPFLLPDNVAMYGWIFLALILTPLVGLGVVVARNLDPLTALVMQSGSTLAAASVAPSPLMPTSRCPSCGRPIKAGVRFCPHCGSASSPGVSAMAASDPPTKTCPACGSDNVVAAKFCRECASPV
jgi:predicted RNA-binding Zn-ribbon protein involved in translation (DUF1610 family)